MVRELDTDLLKRLTEVRHRLVSTGSFGQNYAAAIDAYRLVQQSGPRPPNEDYSQIDPKRDYRELE